MCGLCGVLGADHWSDARHVGETVTYRHARERRAALASAVLAPKRAKVADWQGAKLRLTTPTGRVELADTLADLWHAVDRVLGPIDPLDPDLLEKLDRVL
ncbi:MAG TPA: hypothetical protein VHL31_00440 [Geminicoccus sp.]|jgi:hypothetical protein|uniref:hypothetical protein n=1 Tax=Geminicoccus sp. TaxID=2024832 RepID=UPI002E3256FF|nr:hypothetical protein [Geminicoccus sp.]HEX2524760.1 hypothetical protein [Geminicoccus sp.]